MDIGTKCLIATVCGIALYLCIPKIRAMLRDRYRHFKARRDIGPYRPRRPDPHLERVQHVLEMASARAMNISGKYGIDDFVELLSGLREEPRIWAQVTVTPRKMRIRIEYAQALSFEDRILLYEFRYLFVREHATPVSIAQAPAPHEFEFSRGFKK